MLPPILTQVGRFPVVWIPAHPDNVWQTDDGLPKEGVVIHTMGGTLAGCDAWFRNPSAVASANFGISKQGVIHQYVELRGRAPYANGVAQDNIRKVKAMAPDVKALSEKYHWASQNKWTWSIEHEDNGATTQITDWPLMFEASTVLCATLLRDLPPERRRTFGHYQFDGIDRPYCPGWTTETWRAYDAEVMRLVGEMEGAPTPPAPVEHPDMAEVKRLMDSIYNATHQAAQDSADLFAEMRRLFPDGGI